jgi:hypothetical protein
VGVATTSAFVDNDVPAGGFSYEVVAHRYTDSTQAADKAGDITSTSSAAAVTVEAPTTATTAGGGGTSGGSTGTGAGGAPATNSDPAAAAAAANQAGKVDLKGFAAMLDKARQTGKPQVAAEPPDPGFSETLPFKPADQEPGSDSTQVIHQALPSIHAKTTQRPALLFVAGSLLATVLFMHLVWLKSEVRRAGPLEPTDP